MTCFLFWRKLALKWILWRNVQIILICLFSFVFVFIFVTDFITQLASVWPLCVHTKVAM